MVEIFEDERGIVEFDNDREVLPAPDLSGAALSDDELDALCDAMVKTMGTGARIPADREDADRSSYAALPCSECFRSPRETPW